MTTNEGTKALVEKARLTLLALKTERMSDRSVSWDARMAAEEVIGQLADRLDALTTPQDGGDALEARQPSENDREATEAEIDKAAGALHMAKCCSLNGDSPHDFPEASEVFAAGVVLNAVPRAAVPDAATGELARAHDLIELREFEIDNLDELITELRAERDAALDAIERARAVCLHLGGVDGDVSQPAPSYYVSVGRNVVATEVLAALDGAPEPETAPENYEPKCNGACVVHGSPVTDWPVQYGRMNRETGALHWLKGDPFDSWWHENQDNYEHVKRYTSPPLPVEGESKP